MAFSTHINQTMEFMKVFDQTVREIKREVNLKVLKVPEIEQKVLDATDDEPWGPHGTALADIAQATKKFSECQMVMNVLWTRLVETGKNWRYVYKSLAVIEYLVAHGSERAVDEIIEHTYQISSLTNFEHVEPNGKDVGINVRKKAENIVALLNNKEKIQEVRDKAAANRDKYFGLSSSGVTFKSNSASFSSRSNFQSGDRYGGFGNKSVGGSFKDSYKSKDRYGEDKVDQSTFKSKKESSHSASNVQGTVSASASKTAKRKGKPDKASSNPSQSAAASSSKYEDDFDDFDPRGTSSTKPSTGNSAQVHLFGQNLIGDLLDAPIHQKLIYLLTPILYLRNHSLRWGVTSRSPVYAFLLCYFLDISFCNELQSLAELALPSSLSNLTIGYCPNLKSLPVKGMPSSLSTLYISKCPLLEPLVEYEKGEYWPNIAHIPTIRISEDEYL